MSIINVTIPHLNCTLDFSQDSDGWYVNTKRALAINPELTVCVTHPWYADHICNPPQHEFIVN